MIYVVLRTAYGRFLDRNLRLTLSSHEKHSAAAGHDLGDSRKRGIEQRHRLRKIDDMDAVLLGMDILLHQRIPSVGLMPEMYACLQ